jgi:hypothetical protein
VYYYLVGVAGKTQQLTTVYKVKTRWLVIYISYSTLHLLNPLVDADSGNRVENGLGTRYGIALVKEQCV